MFQPFDTALMQHRATRHVPTRFHARGAGALPGLTRAAFALRLIAFVMRPNAPVRTPVPSP